MELIDKKTADSTEFRDLLKRLDVDSDKGLSIQEYEARIKEFGANVIPEKKDSFFIRVIKKFWGPIPWMIEIAAVLSALIEHWDDFFIIAFLLFLNAAIEIIQEFKAGNAIAALKKHLASKAIVLRDSKWIEIEASDLVPGDIIRIKLGDVLPADIKLIDGDYVLVDEAALTGESLPVEKHQGDIAYSGAIVKQGVMNALVYGTGENTFFGKTAKLVAEAKTDSHFQKAVVKIGDYLIALNFFLVSLIVIVGIFRHDSIWELLQFSLVLTVASIPAAMPAVLSVTMAVGALALSKKKAIVSKLIAIEEMAGMDILCSDKTGTITQNKLTIHGYQAIKAFTEDDILLYGTLASKEEDRDPIDSAIIDQLEKSKNLVEKKNSCKLIHFTPFDPVSKKTEATIKFNQKTFKVCKGAPQVIVALAENKEEIKDEVNRLVDEAAERGFRTLGVGKTDDKDKWQFVGLIDLEDTPRLDSADTISEAKKLNVDVKMVTGDHGAIARETCKQIGLGTKILKADDLEGASDRKAIRMVVESDGFSEVFPEHKYEIVELLQKHGHIVGMTGDGVNDAPALKKADTGIAVDGATDAAKSAADIVFTLPGLSVIIDAIKESRCIFQRMQSYAIYRISETQDVLFFTVLAILIFGQYPVTAMMIVLLAVFNDFPIMAIASDNTAVSPNPEQWDMRKVIGIGTVLGLTNVIFTFIIFYLGKHVLTSYSWHPSIIDHCFFSNHLIHFRHWVVSTFGILKFDQVQTLVFAELAIAGNLTVFLSRVKGPFWSLAPGKGLFWSTIISKLIVSLMCGFGILMAPIGWYIVFIWIYACIQMFITDRMKIFAYKLFDHSGIRFRRQGKIHN
ncbi:MAG TPA: plasma-membrane proton-efflux P-type ATPase [Victivallales bacterium]|nr:plasma-membrane proton-efflux P-type ATPase [Victivallales bacterium]